LSVAAQPPDWEQDKPENLPEPEFDFEISEPVVPPKVTVRNRAALEAVLAFKEPAWGTFSARARAELAQVSLDNGLATPRPAKLLVVFNKDKTALVMMPTSSTYPQGITVGYSQRTVSLNLFDHFASIDRFVPPDRRELFRVYRTSRPITLGDLKGYALYIKMKDFTSEPINRLSDEEKARRQSRRKREDTAAAEDTEPQE